MLSEGKRSGLRLFLNRSISEPGVSAQSSDCPGIALSRTPTNAFSPAIPTTVGSQLPFLSDSSLPCSTSSNPSGSGISNFGIPTLKNELLPHDIKTLEPDDLARKIIKCSQFSNTALRCSKSFLLIDIRSFVAYNSCNIKTSININCADRLNRRRLHQRKGGGIFDLASTRAAREALRKRVFREIVVYDQSSKDIEKLPPQHPLFVVVLALIGEGRETLVLKGGLDAFESSYSELCEHNSMRSKSGTEKRSQEDKNPWELSPPLSPITQESAIEMAPVAKILPFLYLGNARDALNTSLLKVHGIERVLSVSPAQTNSIDGRIRLVLPARDSSQQNISQYFHQAIQYIDDARKAGDRILVHCEAGVSRSPTIVLAYLMKHSGISMLDAYKLLKMRRPVISPNLNFMGQLLEWESTLKSGKKEEGGECKLYEEIHWQLSEMKNAQSCL